MITINTLDFIYKMLEKGMKESHLDEHYEMQIFHAKNVPTKIKNQIKSEKQILDGSDKDSLIIALKAKSKDENTDLLEVKFAKLIKTNVFGNSDDNQDINSEIVKIRINKDEKSEDESGLIYGICCISIKN